MLVQKNEVQLDTITNTLSLDQALSVKVLQLANSPFYGLSGRVRSIRDAINILGMRQLSSLVIAAALTLQFEKLHGQSLHMNAFWRHSIGCATAARQLAKRTGLDEQAAFTAGLLHDVGRLVVDSHHPLEAAQAIAWAEASDTPHCDAEYMLLGIDHTELGVLGVPPLAVYQRCDRCHRRPPPPTAFGRADADRHRSRGRRHHPRIGPGRCPQRGCAWNQPRSLGTAGPARARTTSAAGQH